MAYGSSFCRPACGCASPAPHPPRRPGRTRPVRCLLFVHFSMQGSHSPLLACAHPPLPHPRRFDLDALVDGLAAVPPAGAPPPDDALSGGTPSDGTPLDGAQPGEAPPADPPPGSAELRGASSGGTTSGGALVGETQPDGMAPCGTGPPGGASPDGTSSGAGGAGASGGEGPWVDGGGTQPVGTVPGGTRLDGTSSGAGCAGGAAGRYGWHGAEWTAAPRPNRCRGWCGGLAATDAAAKVAPAARCRPTKKNASDPKHVNTPSCPLRHDVEGAYEWREDAFETLPPNTDPTR
jgi:hypothetical protein